VQGDHRLARAGPSGEDHAAFGVAADYLVLLGLDRGDDVVHELAPFPHQGVEKCSFPGHDLQVPGLLGNQQVVVDPDHLAAPGDQRPPADDALRRRRGSPVERGAHRGAPVDKDALLLLVGQPDPPDVKRLVGLLTVHAAEYQLLFADRNRGKAPPGVAGESLAVEDGLRRVGFHGDGALQAGLGASPQVRKARVAQVDVLLFPRDLVF
jgi:hypothetical protein